MGGSCPPPIARTWMPKREKLRVAVRVPPPKRPIVRHPWRRAAAIDPDGEGVDPLRGEKGHGAAGEARHVTLAHDGLWGKAKGSVEVVDELDAVFQQPRVHDLDL